MRKLSIIPGAGLGDKLKILTKIVKCLAVRTNADDTSKWSLNQ